MSGTSGAKLLLVDDDPDLLRRVCADLESDGYAITCASNADEAEAALDNDTFDLVILDITLGSESGEPGGKDGLAILAHLRQTSNVPVLILSGITVSVVKVHALTAGADDYLTKPFDSSELRARVGAILRRAGGQEPSNERDIYLGDIRIETAARRVWRGDELLGLTALEFDLLLCLARNSGKVLSRKELVELAWPYTFLGDPRVVDVHIMNLRRKIEERPATPTWIVTVRGRGYRLDVPEQVGR